MVIVSFLSDLIIYPLILSFATAQVDQTFTPNLRAISPISKS